MTEPLQSFFAGRWRDASGPEYTTESPHDGSTVARLHAERPERMEPGLERLASIRSNIRQ